MEKQEKDLRKEEDKDPMRDTGSKKPDTRGNSSKSTEQEDEETTTGSKGRKDTDPDTSK